MKLFFKFGPDSGNNSIELELEPSDTVGTLLALLEAHTGQNVATKTFNSEGRLLAMSPEKELNSFGLRDGAIINVTEGSSGSSQTQRIPTAVSPNVGASAAKSKRKGPSRLSAQANIDPSTYSTLTWKNLPPNVPPNVLHSILAANPTMLQELETKDPALHKAATEPTPDALRNLMMKRAFDYVAPAATQMIRLNAAERRLQENPFDLEAQRFLESEINRRNVMENYELALEELPEAFTSIHMLYIDTLVNGVPVKAFVDSGAQSTIMNKACAERCGIMRLLDTRFAGQAVGVGSAPILGRVHMAPLTIGNHHLNCTFTVLDQGGVEFLLGLDMLRRYQACIDLQKNELRLILGGESFSVPFLSEKESLEASKNNKLVPPESSSASGNDAPSTKDVSTPANPASTPSQNNGSSAALGGSESRASGQVVSAAPQAPVMTDELKSKLSTLVNMGFDERASLRVLLSVNGNIDEAIQVLISMMG